MLDVAWMLSMSYTSLHQCKCCWLSHQSGLPVPTETFEERQNYSWTLQDTLPAVLYRKLIKLQTRFRQ